MGQKEGPAHSDRHRRSCSRPDVALFLLFLSRASTATRKKKKGIFILKRNKKVIKFYNKIQKSNFNFSTREQKHAHHTSRRQQRQLSLPLFGAKYADSRLQNIPFAPGFTLAHQPVGSAVVLRLSRHSPCPNLLHKSRLPTQQVHALFSNFPIQKEMTETNSKSKLATSSPSQKFGG